jgi:alcohol dehydrogenase (cytochrome c)
VWYFQHIPGESLDLDTVFERVLIDVDARPLLFTIGKDGLMWKLDRQTGTYLAPTETVFQNIYQFIDHKTGRVRYRPDIVEAQADQWIPSCPSYWGGHNWIASAYSG